MSAKQIKNKEVVINYEYKKIPYARHTIILLHGLGGDLRAWDKEVSLLHKLGYSTLAIDLRGHGKSGRPNSEEEYSLKNFSEDVSDIIKTENITNPILVGHCFGGIVAMSFVVYFPDVLKSLILVDTTYKPPFYAETFKNNKLLNFLLVALGKVSPTLHLSNTRNYGDYIGTEDYNAKRIIGDILHTSIKSYILASEQMINMSAEEFFKKINIPTLVIEGVDDSIFPVDIAAILYQRIKHSSIEFIEDANHILVISNPGELVATIDRFIENLKK